MRLALPFVLFLVLGLAGGVGGVMLRLRLAPPATVAPQAAKPAPKQTPTAIEKKVATDSTATPPTAAAPSAAPTAVSARASHDSAASRADSTRTAQPRRATPDSAALSAQIRLGRMLGAMPPKDAARVLEQLADGEAAAALSTLKEKQAASIIANLPSERAAAMVRAALKLARGDR